MASENLSAQSSIIIGVIAIIATYVYFLIFAQFAFLEIVNTNVGLSSLDYVMAAMGGSGLFASLFCGHLLGRYQSRAILRLGFAGCVLAGVAILFLDNLAGCIGIAALIGISLAFVTVALAASLTDFIPLNRLGVFTGLGTGIAYFICNVPLVFSASSKGQAMFSALVAAAGLLAVCIAPRAAAKYPTENAETACRNDFGTKGFISVVVLFLSLVWLDSAAFFVIQQTAEFRSQTWGSEARLWANATIHLVAAIAAGVMLDRGIFRPTLFFAYLFLAAGVLVLDGSEALLVFSSVLYCVGVSLYSTLLVAFPSRWCNETGLVPRRWRAAFLYGIAGWFGSAMGIGMAQDLQRVPIEFLLVAGAAICLGWFWAVRRQKRTGVPGSLILGAVLMSSLLGTSVNTSFAEVSSIDVVQAGRRVYISEGCIHCHSQFVRPQTRDEEMWGPYVSPDDILHQKPPLIGNRRHGPDLLNVGNRRNADWLRIHLINPRATQPGSSMPSYKHLFEDDRGEQLIVYLLSLGRETLTARMRFIRAWRPKEVLPIAFAEAEELYRDGCASCHGKGGRGDGPLSKKLSVPPRDLVAGKLLTFDPAAIDAEASYAQIIKFGLPGSSMPGHEYYDDREVRGLVRYLKELRNSEQ